MRECSITTEQLQSISKRIVDTIYSSLQSKAGHLLSIHKAYDAAHEGEDERQFLKDLLERKWKGVVFWDDIHLNKEMVEFWGHCQILSGSENVQALLGAEVECQDWSDLGHATGTGVMFLK